MLDPIETLKFTKDLEKDQFLEDKYLATITGLAIYECLCSLWCSTNGGLPGVDISTIQRTLAYDIYYKNYNNLKEMRELMLSDKDIKEKIYGLNLWSHRKSTEFWRQIKH